MIFSIVLAQAKTKAHGSISRLSGKISVGSSQGSTCRILIYPPKNLDSKLSSKSIDDQAPQVTNDIFYNEYPIVFTNWEYKPPLSVFNSRNYIIRKYDENSFYGSHVQNYGNFVIKSTILLTQVKNIYKAILYTEKRRTKRGQVDLDDDSLVVQKKYEVCDKLIFDKVLGRFPKIF